MTLEDPLLPPPIDLDTMNEQEERRELRAVDTNGDADSATNVDDDDGSSFASVFFKSRGPPQIALLMLMVAIGGGCTVGVVPAVMSDRFEHDGKGADYAQTAAAASNLISNTLTFFTSSLAGSFSDEYGRRPIIIAGLTLSVLSPVALLLIQIIPTISPWAYYAASASTGLISWVAVALSCMADVLPPAWRGPGIGLLLSGFLLGFGISPMLSLTLSHIQLSFVSVVVVVSGLLLSIFYLPETLSPEAAVEARERRRETDAQITLIGVLTRPFRDMAILNRSSFFRLLSLLAFFSGMVLSGDQTFLLYYVEGSLGFTDKDVSVMFFLMGVLGIVAQAFLLKPFTSFLGEKRVVVLAFFAGALNNFIYGVADSKYTIYGGIVISSLCGMAFPTISAMKANNVDDFEQGRIQGALYSLQSLASGLGPVLMRFVNSTTSQIGYGEGNMFLFAGGLYLVAVFCAAQLPVEKSDTVKVRRVNVTTPDHGSETSTDGVSCSEVEDQIGLRDLTTDGTSEAHNLI